LSAPVTGALADRVGQRRILIIASLALTAFSLAYAVISNYRVMLALVIVHGIFWSGLLSASAAYMTALLPERRRAEGIAYWGLSTVAAIAVAPTVGFWIYRRGWLWLCIVGAVLNLVMAVIALNLRRHVSAEPAHPRRDGLIEWRVLIVSLTLFLYSFGYGGITSFTALYADAKRRDTQEHLFDRARDRHPGDATLGREVRDRFGYKRVFVPCLILISVGLSLLALGASRGWMIASAVFFVPACTSYPVYVGYVMQHVSSNRRGAAFGAILAAFDTGVGTGSMMMGWLIQHFGFATAFGVAAGLSALALPYFLAVDRHYSHRTKPHGADSLSDLA
jgi:MFS family permease